MMKSFFKTTFMLLLFCLALGALFMPNPLRVDGHLYYLSGRMDQMLSPDTYIIGGEKVKIWGVAASKEVTELEQIKKVAEQMSADADRKDREAANEAALKAEETLKMRAASLKNPTLHCVRVADEDGDAAVMTCYTQNMADLATCLIGRGIAQPAEGVQNAAYMEVHKAALEGKAGQWQGCH